MTGLFVLGAERSGVSMLAHALAFEETLPLCDDLAQGARRIGAGERIVVFAPDLAPDRLHVERMPEILAACPGARVRVVWRQGVDFVNSRRRARPDRHFVEACLLWARSLEAGRRLHEQFPDRVDLIGFHTLLDASSAPGRPLVDGFKLDGAAFAKFLNASAQGRTSLDPRRPVVDAARTAWTMGEVEVFARLCGEAMRSLGEEVDLKAAARRRPLDLARMFYERGYRVGGAEIAPSAFAGAAWTVALPEAAKAPQLRLTAVPAGERRRLRWRARNVAAGGFRLEVVEALTRRPLFVARGGREADIDALLPAHDGLIEMAVVGLAGPAHASQAHPSVELRLVDAGLSYA
jgi:hypothetical protein